MPAIDLLAPTDLIGVAVIEVSENVVIGGLHASLISFGQKRFEAGLPFIRHCFENKPR